MSLNITLTEQHEAELRDQLHQRESVEGAAYVLFRVARIGIDPWERRSRLRLLVREIIPIAAEHIVSADGMHVTWQSVGFVRLLQRAKDEDLVVGIAHSHPYGPNSFSAQDDANERELSRTACNRNGIATLFVSMLFAGHGSIRARVWQHPGHKTDIASINVVGERFRYHIPGLTPVTSPAFARQALAFGPELTAQLRHLRAGIVGNGGTGSPTALMAARMGFGQIALFDEDIVDATNLNRLHGATQSDADRMRHKADVVADEIARFGLGTRVVPIKSWISDPVARDALKSCDVVFSCTDDHSGRLFLNRFAYFYLTPVIDMGLAMAVAEPPALGMADISARITTLLPPEACLMCRRAVDADIAAEEDLRRQNPTEYERRKREAYVRGEGNPNPAVVTFTTEVACMALNEFLNRVVGFRRRNMGAEIRRRFLFCEDRATSANRKAHCPVCGSCANWGMGDVDPFLIG